MAEELRGLVKRHALLNHSFLEAARQGRLRLPELRLFAVQEMFVSVAFPAMMAEVVCKIPYRFEAIRYPLIVNMFEESGERDSSQSHPRLLRKLALSLGVEEHEIDHADPLPETSDYLDQLFALCRSRTYIEGLAAIGYGNEYLVLFEYPVFKKACKAIGCSPEVLQFFDANIHADVEHTDNIEQVMVAQCITPEVKARLREATNAALAARSLFYDGLCRVTGL